MSTPSPQNSPPRRLRTGERLDRFLVLDDLGGHRRAIGGTLHTMDVYSAVEVALRLEPLPRERMEEFLEAYRLARSRVVHEVTLPAMVGAGWREGVGWVATRWIHGVDGADLVAFGGLSPALVSSVLVDLALALSELHARGLVHGDVCPANLRIDRSGKLALVGHLPMPRVESSPALGRDSERVRFAAPERFPGGAATTGGDVFGVGMTAWALLWGADSLPATTLVEAGARHARLLDELRGSADHAALPPILRRALELCLDPDPATRPRSATQLLPLLEEARRIGEARRTEVAPRLAREVRRAADLGRPRRLASARRALDEGHPLAAAARLRRAVATTSPPAGGAEMAMARELQREVIWSTFGTPASGEQEGEEEAGRRVAACLLARRAAEDLGSKLLASLARRRASELSPGADGEDGFSSSLAGVSTVLQENPSDPNAILLLAVATPGATWMNGETPASFRARLLQEADLPQAALYTLAQDLARSPPPEGLAKRIATLATKLSRLELAEVEAAEELAPPSLEELAGAHVPVASVPTMDHDQLEEADVLFTRGQVMVREGRLGEAAAVFRDLLARGALHQEHFYATICGELRTLMWRALSHRQGEEDHLEAMRTIWDLTRDLKLDTLQPLASRLWLGALREGPGKLARIEQLLELAPRSVVLRQAAVQEARARGEEEVWAGHLVETGFLFLERMDLEAASRMFMAAKPVLGKGRVEDGMAQVFEAGVRVAQAAQELRRLEEDLAEDPGPPQEEFRRVREFLRIYPYYRPAAERVVALAREEGRPLPASLAHMRLAQDAFLRGRDQEARAHLRDILALEYGNDEALLYLASIDPPGLGAPEAVPLLRMWLLRREGLPKAARYRGRRELRDGPEDRPYLRVIAEICEELGDDPTPYLVDLCLLDLREGKVEEARRSLREALGHAPDRGEAVRQLLEVPEIWHAFRPIDLMPELAEEE